MLGLLLKQLSGDNIENIGHVIFSILFPDILYIIYIIWPDCWLCPALPMGGAGWDFRVCVDGAGMALGLVRKGLGWVGIQV